MFKFNIFINLDLKLNFFFFCICAKNFKIHNLKGMCPHDQSRENIEIFSRFEKKYKNILN